MLPVTLVVQAMLVHVNALIFPLGISFQFPNNSSSEPRQIRFITRYFKGFFEVRVVERAYPISHDPCSLFRLLVPPDCWRTPPSRPRASRNTQAEVTSSYPIW